MNIEEIANSMVSLLKSGKFETAQKELFAQEVISLEPASSNLPKTEGLSSILEKGKQFRDSVEAWHNVSVSEPIISYNHFAIRLMVELTFKGQEKSVMDEIIVYKVEEGKIKHEQFFY